MPTRKEFLQALTATAAAASLTPSMARAANAGAQGRNTSPGIGLGASFYSFQDELITHRMNTEDCVRALADMGADGIEILGEQSLPDFPNVGDRFLRDWFDTLAKYRARPVCYDCMYDANLITGRLLTEQEAVDIIVRDLKIAKKLGFDLVRAQRTVPVNVLAKSIPFAEKLDVRLSIELHMPLLLDAASMDPYMDMIRRTGTRHFGFVLDFSVFSQRLPRVSRDWCIRRGASPQIAAYVEQAYLQRQPRDATTAEVRKRGGGDEDLHWVAMAYNHSYSEPDAIRPYTAQIMHCHGKVYEMLDDLTEYTIPYDKVVAVLQQAGYNGYICTEYEGQRYLNDAFEVDAVEQTRRHHAMLRKYLGSGVKAMSV